MSVTILAFGAHPDDLEFGAGGILIKAVMNGGKVHMRTITRGESGTAGTPEQRSQEAEAAARVMGGDFKFMDLAEDGHLAYTVEAKIALAREIRMIKPDMLLAPFLQENQHPDHVILGRMVRDAARLARYGGYRELKDLPPHKIKSLYYYAGTGVHERHFDVLVDVSAAKDRWVEAINAHASQLGNRDYLHMVLTHAAYFGTLCNCAYAMPLWTNDPVLVDDVAQIARGGRNF